LILTSFVLFPASNFYNALPGTFRILGSVNGINFTSLYNVTDHTYTSSLTSAGANIYNSTAFNQTFAVTNSGQAYRFFRLVISKIKNNYANGEGGYNTFAAFEQWNLFGNAIV
jgi:hypothetical protein